jgi:putative hemolysin
MMPAFVLTAIYIGAVLLAMGALGNAGPAEEHSLASGDLPLHWTDILSAPKIVFSLILLAFSAFFSGSEVAFYSLHPVRLRRMRESKSLIERLASRLMDHPGSLLTTILIGNSIVNVLLGVVLAASVERLFAEVLLPDSVTNPFFSYLLAVSLTTAVLVFFGEITPKMLVVTRNETVVRYITLPIFVVDRVLLPVRIVLLNLVAFLFKITRFIELKPAPFMTDNEFKALLTEGEASGVIEEDERQMIQGILEFGDLMVKEILVPRPDMIAIKDCATLGEALELVREHEYARIPVYRDDLDTIKGFLYAKDLLPGVDQGKLDQPIRPLIRKAHFVPETMSLADFLKTAQRLRTHIAIAVDEYGGTEGLVTLQDALREIVGNIGEEDDEDEPVCVELGEGEYRLEGSFPLDDLEALTGVSVTDGEHMTIAGFLMEQSDKLPDPGDRIEHDGVLYTVEEVDGKRVSRVRVKVLPAADIEKDAAL